MSYCVYVFSLLIASFHGIFINCQPTNHSQSNGSVTDAERARNAIAQGAGAEDGPPPPVPAFNPRHVHAAYYQEDEPDPDNGEFGPENVNERNLLATRAGATNPPHAGTEVFKLEATEGANQETVNAILCTGNGTAFLLRKMGDLEYSQITFGRLHNYYLPIQ